MTNRSAARMSAVLAFVVAFALVGLLLIGGAKPAAAGTIVADSGFRAKPDGFAFPNYGYVRGRVNLDSGEVQRIFGRAACLTGRGAKCVLNPGVRAWMRQVNQGLSGGHCYGFTTLAQMIHKGQLPQFGYNSIFAFGGGPDPFNLRIRNSQRLQRSIARAYTYQMLPSVTKGVVEGAPKRIVNALIKNLGANTSQSWNLVIFKWGMNGGHGITPYAVEKTGPGKYDIHVYDNNMPGESRRVHVDTVKNIWTYYATTKPGIPQARYVGNARSRTLMLYPNREALGVQPCNVCYGRRGAGSKYNQVSISGGANQHARLLITDPQGRQTGFRNGKLINRIPGAKILPQTSGGFQLSADGSTGLIADSPEPVYLIPKRLRIKIRVDGRAMKVRDRESLGVVGPTFDSTIENLRMGPGKVAYATLSPKKQTLTMTGAEGESSPRVSFGAQTRRIAYRVKASAINAPSRSTLFFAKKPRYQLLRIGRKTGGNQVWRVGVDRFDSGGKASFGLKYRLRGRQVAFLYYGPLAVGKRAYVVIASANGNKIRLLKLKKLKSE